MFADVTEKVGLPNPEHPWPDGTWATPEISPGGVALFDYDGDGRLDILQICHGEPGRFTDTVPNRLFHQEPDGTFREVPGAGGLAGPGYAMGVAIGDFDNDGRSDVFITRFGRNSLYHNNGDGTFTDVTAIAGLAQTEDAWSSSAAFVDYDRDGWLDLFVARFAVYDPKRVCHSADGHLDYCGPEQFPGIGGLLYHNNGDGTFSEVTHAAGVDQPGRGWGVVCAPLTGGDWPDIFVANDGEAQNLWVNQHDGTFKDEAVARGVAYNGAGNPEAGMGVAVGDLANNGRLSLFITHLDGEKNTVYSPIALGHYADKSAAAGMAPVDLKYTGWGCGLIDFDNDGALDVAVVNGRVGRGPVDPRAKLGPFWNPLAEANLLFLGDGKGHFRDAGTLAGDFTQRVENTRGLAFGDIDNDGRIDMVSGTIDNRLRLYRNTADTRGGHWLIVRAMTGKRDALGAKLELVAGDKHWTRLALAAYSYLSSSDPRVHFGLGPVSAVDHLLVTWPSGCKEKFNVPGVDRVITIHEGEGKAGSSR